MYEDERASGRGACLVDQGRANHKQPLCDALSSGRGGYLFIGSGFRSSYLRRSTG